MSEQNRESFWSRVSSWAPHIGSFLVDSAVDKAVGGPFTMMQKSAGQPTASSVLKQTFHLCMEKYHSSRMNASEKKGNINKANHHAQKAIDHRDKFNGTYQKKPTVKSNNKGIEAARQKAAAKPTVTSKGKSTNKGIASYQRKASGKSKGASASGTIKAASASGTIKAASASAGKSGGSSSGGKSSGSSSGGKSSGGQGR